MPGPSGGRIELDLDASRVVAGTKASGDAMKKAAQDAAGVGKELQKWGGHIAKTIAGAGALVRAIAAAGQEINAQIRANADANRKAGGERLDRGIAAARLGFTSEQAEAFAAPGARSTQEMDSLLSALAGAKGPGGTAVDKRTAARALGLFKGGGFGQDEVLQAIEKGRLDELERGNAGRLAQLDSNELALRRAENEASAEALALRSGRGASTRIAQAQRELRNARSPVVGGFQNVVGGLTSPLGGDQIIEAADTALMAHNNELLKQIATNTAPRPALARPPE